jgi:uncharacterized damage-inducible protein DinB
MHTTDLIQLFDYNSWANKKILDQAAKLTEAQLSEPQLPGFSPGSMKATLVHTVGAEWLWRMRMQSGTSPSALPRPEEFPTFASIAVRYAEEAQAMHDFVAALSDAQLQEARQYKTLDGTPRQSIVQNCLTHVVFHGMQHRSECAVLLTNYGFSPGNIDLIFFLLEKGIA